MILPSAAARADYFLAFDSSGDVTVGSGTGGGSVTESQVQAFMYPITDDEVTHGYVVGDLDRSYPSGHISRYIDSLNLVPGTTDVGAALQTFFNFITTYNVGTAYMSGKFATSIPLILGNSGSYQVSQTNLFAGAFDLRALNAIDTMLTFQNTYYTVWNGSIKVVGTGDNQYVNRTCRIGIRFGISAALSAERMSIDRIYGQYFSEYAVAVVTKSTALKIGETRFVDCGSGHPGAGYSLTGNYSNSVRAGSDGSVNQLNTIDVDVQPPTTFDGEARFIVVAGNTYFIDSVDAGAGTITVFPWLDTADVSGTFYYVFGGGILTYGNDSSVTECRTIDTLRCGLALSDQALYGMNVGRLIAQSCGIGLSWGRRGNAAQLGGSIDMLYVENNTFDICLNTRDRTGRFIKGEIGLNLAELTYSCFAKKGASTVESNFSGNLLNWQGHILSVEGEANNILDGDATPTINLFSEFHSTRTINRDSVTITLSDNNSQMNDHWGIEAQHITVHGSNANGSPSGNVTFLPSVGWTINGVASVLFSGFYGPAVFSCKAIMATQNFLVNPVNLLPDPSIEQGTIVSLDANLNDKTDPINLVDKVVGKRVYNQTNGRPVYAAATADIGKWHFSDGTTSNTPV
jgi:hypothetical protein